MNNKDKLEFIVADDSDISVADLFKGISWVKYYRFDKDGKTEMLQATGLSSMAYYIYTSWYVGAKAS